MTRRVLIALAAAATAAALLTGMLGCSQSATRQTSDTSTDASSGYAVAREADGDGTLLSCEDGSVYYSDDEMLVDLNENLTTGYEWTSMRETDLLTVDVDQSIAYDEAAEDSERQATGAGGTHLFGYTGKSAGKVVLSFEYAQPWKGGAASTVLKLTATLGDKGVFENVEITKEK